MRSSYARTCEIPPVRVRDRVHTVVTPRMCACGCRSVRPCGELHTFRPSFRSHPLIGAKPGGGNLAASSDLFKLQTSSLHFPELGPRRPTNGHFFGWSAIFCHLISCSCIMT